MGVRAGQGVPLRVFDIALEIYMVKVSYQQKPYRRIITLAPESASRVQV